MRILCLVLASDTNPEYLQFQRLWRRFSKIHPNVDCYFYKGHPELSQPLFLEDDTLWIRISESLETVYEKTLRAFEHFVPSLGRYDFVFRSNLSTVVSFPHLLEFCAELPRTNCCAALVGLHGTLPFPAGNGFLLSPDLVRRLVEERPPLLTQDDVSIGSALASWNVPIVEFLRPDFHPDNLWILQNYEKFAPEFRSRAFPPNKKLFTWRFKTSNRQNDIDGMSFFIKRLYGV